MVGRKKNGITIKKLSGFDGGVLGFNLGNIKKDYIIKVISPRVSMGLKIKLSPVKKWN